MMNYVVKYFFLNIFSMLIPHPKLRAFFLKILGANIGRNVRIECVRFIQIQYSIKNLHCADNVFIGSGVIIDLSEKVIISKNSLISPGCSLITHQDAGAFIGGDLSKLYPPLYRPININDNVWVGCDTTILPGAEIGSGSVIGAKSLVKNNIPAGVLACGIPAKTKKIIKNPADNSEKLHHQK